MKKLTSLSCLVMLLSGCSNFLQQNTPTEQTPTVVDAVEGNTSANNSSKGLDGLVDTLNSETLPSDNAATQGISNVQQTNNTAVTDNNVVKRYRRKSLSSSSGLEDDSPPRNTPFPPRYANTSPAPARVKLEKLDDSNQKSKVNTPSSANKKSNSAKSL